MVSVTKYRLLMIAVAALALVGVWMIASDHETASADPKPPVAVGCEIFGVPADECPDGALIVHTICTVPEVALTSPSSELSTYSEYLDIDAILNYPGGPYSELFSGIQAPGGITLEVTPSGKLNIQCWFDVSEYLEDDRPSGTLISEFLCGPPFNPATVGKSRLTSNGMLRINCHWATFP